MESHIKGVDVNAIHKSIIERKKEGLGFLKNIMKT